MAQDSSKQSELIRRREAPLITPTDLGATLRSIGHIARIQRIKDNDATYVDPLDMLAELREVNKTLAARLREMHQVVDEHRDIASASVIESWIDETERRTWFLFESSRRGVTTGH